MYADDFKAYPPGVVPLSNDPDTRFYFDLLYPYTKERLVYESWDDTGGRVSNFEGNGIWACPSLAHLSSGWPFKTRTLQYNSRGCGSDGLRGSLGLEGARESTVVAPAKMVALGDPDAWVLHDPCSLPVVLPHFKPVSVAGWIELGIIPDLPNNRILKVWQPTQRTRHGGRWHVVFCDGHVGKLQTKELFGRQEEVRKLWNRDNAPHFEIDLNPDPLWD
jgi:prepilin-type processing-associated H-X9-DG protein